MRALLPLALLAIGALACSDGGPSLDLTCATPDDAAAQADISITAKVSLIDLGDGERYTAWTFNGDIPGPVIRLNVGETRRVKLINELPGAASLHFHGVTYSAADDGTPEHPESMVNPGCAHVYTITATQPGVWAYHSHRETRFEMSHGLHGAVVVPSPNEAPADREYVVFLGQLGIEEGGEEGEGGGSFAGMTINGRTYGRAEVIRGTDDGYVASSGDSASARVGDLVRWRILSVSPDDAHTFHLHGHRWCDRGGLAVGGVCPSGTLPIDNVEVFPAQGFTAEYIEDQPGDWMLHCHVADHMMDGMFAFYHVDP